jgi:hypothetical protein
MLPEKYCDNINIGISNLYSINDVFVRLCIKTKAFSAGFRP